MTWLNPGELNKTMLIDQVRLSDSLQETDKYMFTYGRRRVSDTLSSSSALREGVVVVVNEHIRGDLHMCLCRMPVIYLLRPRGIQSQRESMDDVRSLPCTMRVMNIA